LNSFLEDLFLPGLPRHRGAAACWLRFSILARDDAGAKIFFCRQETSRKFHSRPVCRATI
jgi:hypothetical protein